MRVVWLLESEGGQVIAGFGLLLIGAGFAALSLPKAEDIIVAAITLIARAMLGNGRHSK